MRLRPNTTSASVVRVAYDDGHFGHDIYGPQLSLVPDAPGGQPQHQQFDDDAWASETCTVAAAKEADRARVGERPERVLPEPPPRPM